MFETREAFGYATRWFFLASVNLAVSEEEP